MQTKLTDINYDKNTGLIKEGKNVRNILGFDNAYFEYKYPFIKSFPVEKINSPIIMTGYLVLPKYSYNRDLKLAGKNNLRKYKKELKKKRTKRR